ncbi:MAG: substrate-binding domain-containing protein [Treponema sp.]|uniref:LacI family DNA-binding transcriptional regulator n=1 Tax=Treponema sp. TaxID=166 RepID=UPI003FA1CDDC
MMTQNKLSPKTKKVYEYLLHLFNNGNLPVGEQIPAENEIAEKLKVSRPTVAKAIKILVQEGKAYRKSGVGTFLKDSSGTKKRKKIIGLLFPLIGRGEIFHPITEEIAKLSETLNFSLIWGGQFNGADITGTQMEQMIDFYVEQKVDGILLAPMELTKNCFPINKKIINKLDQLNIPIVLVDGEYNEFPLRSKYDLVGIDNFRAGYISAEHFIRQGEKRIDFLRQPFMAQTVPQRIMGYQQALLHSGIKPCENWIHTIHNFSAEDIFPIINAGAKNIICANDNIAMQFVKGLAQLDIRIPKDVRISGFDNIEAARYFPIALTTIAQPCEELAKTIINVMLSRIKNPDLPARTVMLNFELKIRESSIINKNVCFRKTVLK